MKCIMKKKCERLNMIKREEEKRIKIGEGNEEMENK